MASQDPIKQLRNDMDSFSENLSKLGKTNPYPMEGEDRNLAQKYNLSSYFIKKNSALQPQDFETLD